MNPISDILRFFYRCTIFLVLLLIGAANGFAQGGPPNTPPTAMLQASLPASNNTKERETGLLAVEALIDSGIVASQGLKFATQRPRPNDNNRRSFFKGDNSFSSGHATRVRSVATVIAETSKLIPMIAPVYDRRTRICGGTLAWNF